MMPIDNGEIVLQLGLKEGRYADAAVAAESLLAWIDLARDAARAIDPYADIRVELLGREEGSLKQVLRLVDDHLATINQGADQYPYLKKAAVGLAIAIATSGLSTFVQQSLTPAVQNVALTDKDRELFGKWTKAIEDDAAVSRATMRFFRQLERDPAITHIDIKDGRSGVPLTTIDQKQFALRGGLYGPEEDPVPDEVRRETWNVVLMQAPFYASARHWGFERDGLRFTAKMEDLRFLQGIVDRTLDIGLHEGVTMRVQIEWKERNVGGRWEVVQDSRRITRVLSARTTAASSSEPEEDDQADQYPDGQDQRPPE